MLKNQITLSLEDAQRMYKSNDTYLKEIALRAFPKEDLTSKSFTDIKTLEDACNFLNLNFLKIKDEIDRINKYSTSSAIILQLEIIVAAINYPYTVNFDSCSNGYVFYPRIHFTLEEDTIFEDDRMIGKIQSNNKIYIVKYGIPYCSKGNGYGNFDTYDEGELNLNLKILGCASENRAEYLSRQFGTLIAQFYVND